MKSNSFQNLLQKYFLERLINQQNVSACTIESYRDAFRILFKFAQEELHIKASSLSIQDIKAENILKFLDYLERVRKNKPETVNNRLAVIKSFFEYVSYECPEYAGIIRKVKLIPARKVRHKEIDYLTKEEVDSLLEVCDMYSSIGRRDKLMILLLFNSGMRVSEMAALKRSNTIFNNGRCFLSILGKGRKIRTIPLWATTQKILYKYINENGVQENDYLLSGKNVPHLTRSGIRNRINCIVEKARPKCPSLQRKNVSPHVFRHSTAMALLQAGIDLSTIAIWLGHESVETTHKYMVADMTLKEKALARMPIPSNGYGNKRYRSTPDILKFLEDL
jgi:site-specific recombinase XerD